ncbi:hypothetical protein TheveDRAFT_1526 [Thermanaerovibrio velox DSM 12556]|uniref:Uncharacterized protein n=2 Tax=Thermanaerovibrio TaxID=81461 RepID=H0UPT5_9BACT|nr:hypothetical protein TheveDRAFT_1526 [Thermanaerovibrio velox DSM 12556]
MTVENGSSDRSFRERMGCAEAVARVVFLWVIFLGFSLALKRLAPQLSLDVRPVNPLKAGVAMAGLWAAFKVAGWLTQGFMDALERRYGP